MDEKTKLTKLMTMYKQLSWFLFTLLVLMKANDLTDLSWWIVFTPLIIIWSIGLICSVLLYIIKNLTD